MSYLWYLIGSPKPFLMIFFYRIANWFSRHKYRYYYIIFPVAFVFLSIYKLITEFIFSSEIPASTKIGKNFIVHHGHGIVINKNAVIGDRCQIRHNVTIGNAIKNGMPSLSPIIGNDVDIGAGAIIIGPISIGSNVKIGAGAIVTKSIPSNCIVIGNPARVIYESADG